MKLSDHHIVKSTAVAIRAGAFALLLGAALPAAAQGQTSSMPFSGTPIAVPGSFEAENFDLGGEGVAYHDNVPGNAGGQYRLSEDVDIILSTDALGGGYVVNNFETGEWLAYTINVAATAQYNVELRASSRFSTSAFHIEVDGGVTPETAPLVASAGANVLVAGSAVFKGGKPEAYRANIAAIRSAAALARGDAA